MTSVQPERLRDDLLALIEEWERRCRLTEIYHGGSHISGLSQAAGELRDLVQVKTQ